MGNMLESIDSFPKAFDDFRVRTTSGGIVSILTVVIMSLLLFSELLYHNKTEVVDHLSVNTTFRKQLKVDFDILFPEISCNLLSVDAVDDRGVKLEGVVQDIYKHALTSGPNPVKRGAPEKLEELGNTLNHENDFNKVDEDFKVKTDGCGNCYGAEQYDGQCCNTCDEVREAYKRKGWVFNAVGITQCSKESALINLKEQFATEGGCEVYGTLIFKQDSGKFHISPHKQLNAVGQGMMSKNLPPGNMGMFNIMDLISFTFDQFNISHTIRVLRFGDHYPGFKSPLDGHTRIVKDTHGMHQYYFKVIPTKYKFYNGKKGAVETNQYSYTEHLSHLAPGSGRGLPGLYFSYETSPITALLEEKKSGWLNFLVSFCAIAGGFYTVMGLLDSFLQWAYCCIFDKPSLSNC